MIITDTYSDITQGHMVVRKAWSCDCTTYSVESMSDVYNITIDRFVSLILNKAFLS